MWTLCLLGLLHYGSEIGCMPWGYTTEKECIKIEYPAMEQVHKEVKPINENAGKYKCMYIEKETS